MRILCPVPTRRRSRTRGLALIGGLLLPTLASCSSTYPDRNGQLGLTREGDHIVVLAHTCSGGVRVLDVSADRQGLDSTQTNPTLGALIAHTPASGDVRIDLDAPGPDWEVTMPITLPTDPGKGVIVTAADTDAHTEMQQTSATVREIRALAPGQVHIDDEGEGHVVTTQQFRAQACPACRLAHGGCEPARREPAVPTPAGGRAMVRVAAPGGAVPGWR